MNPTRCGGASWVARCAALLILLATGASAHAVAPRVLVVGGGPEPEHNQVAIESNVRYLLRLLPGGAPSTVLFADGDPTRRTVLYETHNQPMPLGQRLVALILDGPDAAAGATLRYRRPAIAHLYGAARRGAIAAAFSRLRSVSDAARRPLLLYFTGHGSPSSDRDLENNVFDLWGDSGLSVRDLAAQIAALPPQQHVAVLMVQCFSGAFGNLLFEGGDPARPMVDRDIVGFFATVKDRMAAGCTPAVNEKEYHDFTSYFLAALTGRDRVGRPVTGADYNGDGRVGMDEAFCYALAHDTSIDVPVCTSDVFLRRYVRMPDEEAFATPFTSLLAWAPPGQRAALETLADALHLSGDDGPRVAYRRFAAVDGVGPDMLALSSAQQAFETERSAARKELLRIWPVLKRTGTAAGAAARLEAAQALDRPGARARFASLLRAERSLDAAEAAAYQHEIAEARLIRFVRLVKSVALAHAVRTEGEPGIRRRFERLVAAESRTLLPRADASRFVER